MPEVVWNNWCFLNAKDQINHSEPPIWISKQKHRNIAYQQKSRSLVADFLERNIEYNKSINDLWGRHLTGTSWQSTVLAFHI